MMKSRSEWIADLRHQHRPETVLGLLQFQLLGPGLYPAPELARLLGIESRTVNAMMVRLKETGLVEYENWGKRGRLVWWIARHDDLTPDREMLFPRWILQANAVREFQVLFGTEKETAERLGVHWRTLSNFLNESRSSYRLLGEWSIRLNPIHFVQRNDVHVSKP